MKRRLFSLFLALTLVVGMLPAPAFAQETEPTQVTEAPTEAPATEAPATEVPATEAPATEVPATGAPATEAPAAEPTPAPTEALAPETTVAPAPTEAPTEPAPTEDEAVAAVQAMIDALPDVDHMSEEYIDALVEAYSAYETLSESQQAQITGVEKLEALFGWVNSQVSTLATEETISGEVTWNDRTFNTPVKLTGDTTLTLVGDNKIECEKPLDLNGHELIIQGTGSLELVGSNNSGTPQTSGAIYDSTWTSTSSPGGGMVIEGGTVIVHDDVKNAVAVRYLYMDGGRLEAYGARSGIVTTQLQMTDGSLYATGSTRNGIDMWNPCYVSAAGLNILVSNEPNAQEADMEDGTTKQIENSEPKKTVAIGKFSTSPSISVQPQQGYLYEATAKTAAFALSGRNVDLSALTLEWTGAHTGLTAAASADGKTVTVTTDETVQAGTYGLKVSAGEASRTVVVTVSGPPIRILTRPVDTISTDPEAGLVSVSAYLTDGHTGSIAFQWKREDGTPIAGYTDETVPLIDLVELEMLTKDESKPWLQTIRIYCTLSYDGYSLDTDTVTVGLNSCTHTKVDHEGYCAQCGQKKGDGDALLVREDGLYFLIANAEQDEADAGHFMYSGGNFYLTGDVPNKTVNVSYNDVGGKDVTLDLQGHALKSLQMGNFPYGTFTVKNGILGEIGTSDSGKLILENIRYQGKKFDNEFDLTVQGENTRFERQVTFWGTTHLRGGHFEQGLDSTCAGRALELLEEGFAFYNSANEVVDATDSARLVGKQIHVASHTCDYTGDYRYGKCDCGRSCDHQGTTDENGYCTNCGTFVYPFAIGEKLYTGLEAALTAAQAGDTVTLRGDYDMQGAAVEIKKSITLELNGHTLSGWPYAPILTILAPDVTIQNGTVKNTDTSKSSPAVEVGSLSATGATLTVKDAIFEGSESHGTPRNYGLSIFAGNTAQAENGTFTGGISVNGSLTLSGGKADRIYVGTGVTYASLLADGYAYQSSGGELVTLEDMNDSTAVQVVKCTHPDGLTADTACPYCGKKCGHENIDQTTGLCPKCGYQMAASLTVNETTTFFNTFRDAAAAANGQTGALLTLLKDEVMQDTSSLTFGGGKITIDWNGHTLSGQPTNWNTVIALDGAAELTLRDSSGNNAGVIYNQNADAIWVRGGSLTIESGTYASRVFIPVGTAKISGGIFKNDPSSDYDYAIDTGDSRCLAELMAPGYTLALDSKGTNLYDVYANKKTPEHTTVYVVPHAFHTFDESGKCACGAGVPIQVEAGTESFYFGDFESAVNQAKTLPGSRVRLLEDVTHSGDSGIYIDSGIFTIDWNGHTLSGKMINDLLVITGTAKVTLTDSVGTGTTGGLRNVGGAAIGVYYGGSLTVRGGVYSPQLCKYESAYGSIQISGGRFENPEDGGRNGALYCFSGSLADLLAPGYAFAYEDNDSLFDVYGARMPENNRSVRVVEHPQHEFCEDGQCACGYVCPHTEVDEAGDCILCGKQFYVRGTYADETTHYYGTLSDALEDPAVTQAVMIRSFVPVCESWDGGDRSVTLDLNGIAVVVKSIQGGHLILRDSTGSDSNLGMAEIQKDGQVTLESGSIYPQGETLSVYGKLTVTGGYVDNLTAMEGSTVSLSGGTFDKIVGSGVTLKELLAEDCYYAELGGEAPRKYADTDTVLEQVSVVVCDHTSVREDKQGHFPVYTCNCGKVRYLLTVTDGSGSVTYHSDYSKGFAYAAKCSGVVRLLKKWPDDQTITMDVNGTVAIDMSGKSMTGTANLIIADGTTLKIVSDGAYGWDSQFPAGSITVQSGGKFILPAKGPSGGDNKLKITSAVTVEAGAQAGLSGGYCQVNLRGEAWISGGEYGTIDVRGTENKLTVTGGEIGGLYLWGEIQNVKLSGGSVERLWVSEMDPDTSLNYRTVTFEDIQSLLAPGKAFRKADNTWLTEGDVEEFTPPMLGAGTVKKLSDVTIADVPMTGAAVYCQLGADTYEETVSTQYNVGEMDSSGNVVFRLGVRTQPQEVQSGVTVQWYQLGAEDSRTLVGTDLTCPLDTKLPVGTHRFLAVVNCSGYVLESQPFAVTITPRVVNITGGFTAQDRDYGPEDRSVQIIQGEVTFDKKAEGDDLGAQANGGTVATPDAGQNRTVDYSVTLTGEDKDNYTLGSKPDLTVTIRPIAQTLTFAETAVTKTYGDSPFVNALVHSAGDGQITYSSSDPAVATVGTDGTVTIRGAGEARITATAAATQNYVETAASFDLTVAKATGTVRNRNYSLGYLYGDDIPTPERKYFEASSTGAFRYSWSPAAPKNAGNYQLTVTVDEDGNYTSATLVLNVLVKKNVWVRPTLVKAENETVDGKKDGKVTYTDTPALEYRIKHAGEWLPVAVSTGAESVTVEGLAPGTYEFRRPGDENHFASSPETITIQPGPKLTVTLPSPQTGYTLTADKVELSWHDSLKLTLTVAEGYYKTASFAVKAGNRTLTEENGTFALTDAEENVVITLEGVEKDEKAPGLSLQNWIFGQGVFQGMASRKDWKDISTATAPYYVISTRGNYFTVEASDGETGLASASYLRSRTALTREALEQAAWEPVPEESLNQAGPVREKMIQLDLGEWYFYVKAVDKAGNVSYVGSDKLIREENAPRFGGVINGATYYTTQKVTITDDYALSRYLPPMDRYWKDISGTSYEVTLEGNREGTYTIKVEDACQNTDTITVYMKPISSLTEDIRDLTEDNVCKSDLDQLTQAEKALKALDTTNATAEEKKIITEALDHIGKLRTVLEEVTQVEAMIAALPDSVEPYQQTVEDTQIKPARQAYSDLTDHQKTLVDSTKLDKLVRLEAQLDAWTITEGDGQTWYKGSGKSLSFTVNGQKRKFDGIRQYIGSGVSSLLTASGEMDKPFTLTLKPEFLQCQTPGEHSFTMVYSSGLYSGYLSISVTYTVETPANYLDVTDREEFEGKTTVTVDGKEYPIEEMAGYLQRIPTQRYVNLPETGDLLTIYSFKDGTPAGSYTNYPTGMQVFRITRQEGGAKAEEITEFANLLNYAGCSIRLTGTKGIRMITGIGENARTALTGAQGLAGYTLEEYGTVVMRGVGTPTLENSKSHNFAYKKGKADPVFARVGGMIQYTNVLVGFSLEDCKDMLTLRPYIILKDTATGETVTLYGGCVSRSIGYVAKQNENTYKPGTAGYKYVHEIIDVVYGKTEQGGETK